MIRAALVVAAAVAAATHARPAAAFDLTGTWSGATSCTSFFQGAKLKFKDAPTVEISTKGDAIGLRADFGGGDVDTYVGHVIPDPKKPDEKGQVKFIACGTDSVAGNGPNFDELGRLSAVTKASSVKATLEGLSFYSDPGVDAPEAGTCKWKLTRMGTAESGVPVECLSPSILDGRSVAPATTAAPRSRRHRETAETK